MCLHLDNGKHSTFCHMFEFITQLSAIADSARAELRGVWAKYARI